MRFLSQAIIAAMTLSGVSLHAEEEIQYDATIEGGLSSGKFAPYYIASGRFGTLTQGDNALLNVGFTRPLDMEKKLDWTYGARVVTGASSSVGYDFYNAKDDTWSVRNERPAAAWLQELYAGVKWRSLYFTGGMKQQGSRWMDEELTSGDVITSNNSRPLPGFDCGLVDFRTFPGSKNWLEVKGSLQYGWFTENAYLKHHFNYYNSHITLNQAFCYRDIYLRTRASEPFSFMIGAQVSSLFGGTTYHYKKGVLSERVKNESDLWAYMKMFAPMQGGSELYYDGQHLGCWDLSARYRFKNGDELTAYTQWLWEDGSGMGKLNGWDGLWGIQYKFKSFGWIKGIAVEYLDFTNQSGPVHHAPQYINNGNSSVASGADNYYNNYYYNAYANYGMSMGSPAFMSPIYNTDGFPSFRDNMFRGFHFAMNGNLLSNLSYNVKAGYRKGYGTPMYPLHRPVHLTSLMAGFKWDVNALPGLSATGQAGLDRGNMPANTFGVLLGVKYTGSIGLFSSTK